MTVLQKFKENVNFYQCLHVLSYLNLKFYVHNSFNILIVLWKSFIFLRIKTAKYNECFETQINQYFDFNIFKLF